MANEKTMINFDLDAYLQNTKNYSEVTPKMSVPYWVKKAKDGEEFLNIYTGERLRATDSGTIGSGLNYLLRDACGTLRLLSFDDLQKEFTLTNGNLIHEVDVSYEKFLSIKARQKKESSLGEKVYLGVFIPNKLVGAIKTVSMYRKFDGTHTKTEFPVAYNLDTIDLGNNEFFLNYRMYNRNPSAEEQAVMMLTHVEQRDGRWRYTTVSAGVLQISVSGSMEEFENFDISNPAHVMALRDKESYAAAHWRYRINHGKGDYVICENTLAGSVETVGQSVYWSSRRVINGHVFKMLYNRRSSYEYAKTLPLILNTYEGIRIKYSTDMNTILCEYADNSGKLKFELGYVQNNIDIAVKYIDINSEIALDSFRTDKAKNPRSYELSKDYAEDSSFYELTVFVAKVMQGVHEYKKRQNSLTHEQKREFVYKNIAENMYRGIAMKFSQKGFQVGKCSIHTASEFRERNVPQRFKESLLEEYILMKTTSGNVVRLILGYSESNRHKGKPRIAVSYQLRRSHPQMNGKMVWVEQLRDVNNKIACRIFDDFDGISQGSAEWNKKLVEHVIDIVKLWNVVEVSL